MDLLTQGVLGAALAQSVAPRDEARLAAGIGFGSGMLADADTLIDSATDPLLVLEYHRHFTHALAFVPLGALVAAALLWPLVHGRVTVARLYLYALLGYSLSGLLDACTSYGTQLFWPFSDERVAWRVVSVVDPAFTLLLGVPLLIGAIRRRAWAARVALALAAGYLVLGLAQRERAEAAALALAAERGRRPDRVLVKPTMANLVLWRSVYVDGGRIHADGVRVGVSSGSRIFEGGHATLFEPDRESPWARPGSAARSQLDRFARLSDGYLVRHPRRPEIIGDARYAMLPTAIAPLWGIEFDGQRVDARARFVTDRTLTREERRRFLDMLLDR